MQLLKRLRAFLGKFFPMLYTLIEIFVQITYGLWKLSKMPRPWVTFFGGAKFKPDDFYFKQAMKLAQLCAERGVSVLTGGGPGIMEAANCGVFEHVHDNQHNPRTMGVGVKNLPEESSINRCVIGYNIMLDNFAARKLLLIYYSQVYIFFPGGYGTLDELGEILTLIKTNKLKKAPIILYDRAFWSPLMTWIHDFMVIKGLVLQHDAELITIVDNLEDILAIIDASIQKEEGI